MLARIQVVLVATLLAAPAAGCKDHRSEASVHGVAAGETAQEKPAPAAAPTPHLDLVLLVVIDQLPSWSFEHDSSHLEGGLARLLGESVYFPEAEYPYASTFTAPGHAAIGSGAPPAVTGIMANGWFRKASSKYLSATADADYPELMVGEHGDEEAAREAAAGGSPKELRVEGIADALRRDHPKARSVSMSLKQRAAILMTGRHPDLAVWYEAHQVAMTTSRFYADKPPAWLEALARDEPIAAHLDEAWSVKDADFLRRHTGIEDDAPGEGGADGFGTTFPHSPSESALPARGIRATPAGIEILFEAARAAVAGEKLGKHPQTDLLAVSISSHDYAGHYWGQESWERFDMLRHADRELGRFLDYLDQQIGKDHYAVVLTSDHGAVPLVERSAATGYAARRITYRSLLAAAQRGLVKAMGKGGWVLGYAANSIYLTKEFARAPAAAREAGLAAAAAELRAVPGVGFAAPTEEVAGDCSERPEGLPRLVCESARADSSGEIALVPDRYSLFIEAKYPTGTGHGTPSSECRHVPVLVKVPGVEPRRAAEAVSTLQVAPTLAKLLGVSAPAAAKEKPLPLEGGVAH